MPLRQYRACVVDSLGLGITCVLYHSSMCTRHPNLVSSAFYAIPIFHIIICKYSNECEGCAHSSNSNSKKADNNYYKFVVWHKYSSTVYIGMAMGGSAL